MWNRICNYLDVKTHDERTELHSAEIVDLARESNRIVVEANDIAREAINKADKANLIAWLPFARFVSSRPDV